MKQIKSIRGLGGPAVACLTAAFAAGALSLTPPSAQAVAVQKLTLGSNPSFNTSTMIAPAMINAPLWKGTVTSVAGNVITVDGLDLPADLGRRDAAGVLDVSGFAQYVVFVTWEANATFPSTGKAGDWWYVEVNTTGTLTVTPGVSAPSAAATLLELGDRLTVYKLTSVRDLFGGPGGAFASILNPDVDGFVSPDDEDVINTLNGTSFNNDIVYYNDGSTQGYLVNGTTLGDGQYITVGPDEGIFLSRLANTPSATAISSGRVHHTPVTHFFPADVVPVSRGYGTSFPVNMTILATGLASTAGFNLDADGFTSPSDEDVVNEVTGTSFTADLIRFVGPPAEWLLNGGLGGDTYIMEGGRGYFFSRSNPSATPPGAPLIHRQPDPVKR